MDNKLLAKIPKKYHVAIKDIFHDEDGYWCIVGCESGWKLYGYFSDYTIHEDIFTDVLRGIRKSLRKENTSQ